jgi:hypothetical protein
MNKKSFIGTVLAIAVGALVVALVVKGSKSAKSKVRTLKGVGVVE